MKLEDFRIRRVNGRKAPLDNVIDSIQSLGFSVSSVTGTGHSKSMMVFQDNWVAAGRPEPRTTSRFDTRVDYMFSSEVNIMCVD